MQSITAEQLINIRIHDWVRERRGLYRNISSGQVIRADARKGVWTLTVAGRRLGQLPKTGSNAIEDLVAATGPDAQAVIARWMSWMQVQLCEKGVPGGTYRWHMKADLVRGLHQDIKIALPAGALLEMQPLGAIIDHGDAGMSAGLINGPVLVMPLIDGILDIDVPCSAHGRLDILSRNRSVPLTTPQAR